MSRVIVVTSGKGGVGKTTITANLGRALARAGQKTVVLDVDLGLNNLDVVLGVENKVVYDLIDVIEGRCRLKQALIPDCEQGLFILPSCHSYDKSCITGQNIKLLINGLKQSFDYVLIDCPAGIEAGFHRAVSAASEAMVIVTPHISSIRDADKVLALLQGYQLDSIEVVVNRARGDLMLSCEAISIDDIAALIKQKPIGIIPEDDTLGIVCSLCLSDCAASSFEAFEVLAHNIHNGERIVYDVTQKYKGIFGRLKRNLKKLI